MMPGCGFALASCDNIAIKLVFSLLPCSIHARWCGIRRMGCQCKGNKVLRGSCYLEPWRPWILELEVSMGFIPVTFTLVWFVCVRSAFKIRFYCHSTCQLSWNRYIWPSRCRQLHPEEDRKASSFLYWPLHGMHFINRVPKSESWI